MEDWIQAEIRHHEPGWGRAYPLWCSIIRQQNLRVGAQVGVAFGGHSEAILNNTEVRKLYSVDMFRPLDTIVTRIPSTTRRNALKDLFGSCRPDLPNLATDVKIVHVELAAAAAVVPAELDFVDPYAYQWYDGVFRISGCGQ